MWRDWHIDIDDVGISTHDFFEQIVQRGYFEPFLDYFFSILEHHWVGILPYPDAELIYNFQPVIFITARKPYLLSATHSWIDHHFPTLDYIVYQARSKDKIDMLLELGLDGIVEDRLRTANQVAERGLTCYLLNRSWNLGRYTHPNVIRINSLREIPNERIWPVRHELSR